MRVCILGGVGWGSLLTLSRAVQSSRAVFAISLDNTRNRIARMNLALTISTVSLSFSMVVAGFFGMNLVSGLEDKGPLVFAGVVSLGLVGSFVIYLVCKSALTRSASRQHQRMIDHRTFKTVLEKLDHVYDLLRGNPSLSQRLVHGGKLKRSELQDLLDNGPGAQGGAGGGSKNHLDHMSFHGSAEWRANPSFMSMSTPLAATDREIELLFQILNGHKEGLLNRSDLLDELARWSKLAATSDGAYGDAGTQQPVFNTQHHRPEQSEHGVGAGVSIKDALEHIVLHATDHAAYHHDTKFSAGPTAKGSSQPPTAHTAASVAAAAASRAAQSAARAASSILPTRLPSLIAKSPSSRSSDPRSDPARLTEPGRPDTTSSSPSSPPHQGGPKPN